MDISPEIIYNVKQAYLKIHHLSSRKYKSKSKPTMTYYLTLISTTSIKTHRQRKRKREQERITSVGKDVEIFALEYLYIVGGNVK